jgi:hypothetical protein
MTKEETRQAEVADYFDEACQQLGLAKPENVPIEVWQDEHKRGWFELQIGPDGSCPRSDLEKRTIGAWGLALFRFGQADKQDSVVFPGPNGLSRNHLSVRISPAVYEQTARLLPRRQAA